MTKTVVLIAWWFSYTLFGAKGDIVQTQVVGPFQNEVTCERIRENLITSLTRPKVNASVDACIPDQLERMPR